MLSLWDFCCGKGAWWRISYQSSANMSGSLHEAEYHRLIHLTSQDRFLHDATCIRLWYALCWSHFFRILSTLNWCFLSLLLTRRANAQMTHIQVQNWKNGISYVSKIHTSHTKHTMPDLFNVCKKHTTFKQGGQESRTKFAVYDSLHACDLKTRSRSSNLLLICGPKPGYNNTKFEKPHLNSVHDKANNNFFNKSGNVSMISLEYAQRSKLLAYSWPVWCA